MKMEAIGNVGVEITESEGNRENSNRRITNSRNNRFNKERSTCQNTEQRRNEAELSLTDPDALPGTEVELSLKEPNALPGNEAALSMRCRTGLPGFEVEKSMQCRTGLPGIEVEKRFRSAAKTMQRSEAAAAFYLAELDERRLWLELGYSSVIAYAAEASDIAAKKTYALLNIGRRLRELPIIRAAFDEGRIGWTKVRDILRLKGDIDENEMLEKARTSTSRELELFVSNSNGAANRNKWKSIHRLEENQAGIFDQLENTDPVRQTLPARSPMRVESGLKPSGLKPFGKAHPSASSIPAPASMTSPEVKSAATANSGRAGLPHSLPASDESDVSNSFPVSAASGVSIAGKDSTSSGGQSQKVSVTLKFTPEDYAIYLEARRVWKRKNRSAWKQERMVVSNARRYLEEVAAAGHAKRAPGLGAFSNATVSNPNEQVGSAAARTGEKESGRTPESDSTPAQLSGVNGKTAEPVEIPMQSSGVNGKADQPGEIPTQSSNINGKTAEPEELPVQPTEANSGNGFGPVIVDSPYNIYIHHCPECGKNSMTGKHGDRIEVDESLFEKALCDGALHTAYKRGASDRKKRSVSPALRKKIFMRDGGVCRVPGCGKTSSLEVHHVKPLSAGGGNDPANLILCCSFCHSNIHEGRLRVSGSYPEFEFQHIGRIGMINQRLRRVGG